MWNIELLCYMIHSINVDIVILVGYYRCVSKAVEWINNNFLMIKHNSILLQRYKKYPFIFWSFEEKYCFSSKTKLKVLNVGVCSGI